MEYNYDELLKKARSQIPEVVSKRDRLELPGMIYSVIGMRTVIHNFKEITDALNRPPEHLLKFLTREMATAATMQDVRVIFQGKFSRETFQRLIKRYLNQFVVCPVCKRPDTKMVKEKRLLFLKCDACGARSSVRQI
ncbi:translation initiation factor IF-2 subunit beta [Candidatus Bathyarchaeota archaeon]|nr:translation initiation factor IF-2 subunit beta [Candidatus Bathyarchaeota archaeon]